MIHSFTRIQSDFLWLLRISGQQAENPKSLNLLKKKMIKKSKSLHLRRCNKEMLEIFAWGMTLTISWLYRNRLVDLAPTTISTNMNSLFNSFLFLSCSQLSLTTGAMVAAVLKVYFIGTALSVLAVLFGLADSVGGLMYHQNRHYTAEPVHQTKTQRQDPSASHRRGSLVTKHIGS